MRTEKDIVAAIEGLRKLGEAACLNGHRPDAQYLLDEWMELPSDDDDAPMPDAVDWLWDVLEPLPEPPLKPEECKPPHLLDTDVNGWMDRAVQLLKSNWRDFDAFDYVECEPDIEYDEHGKQKGPVFLRSKAGAAFNEADELVSLFEMTDKDPSRWTEENTPEVMAAYLCWGALQAHLEQGKGPYHEHTLKDSFGQFEARVLLWREFRFVRCENTETGELVADPVEALTWLRDWDRRGRPEHDAPLVRINGQAIQADVGQMMNNGLKELEQSGLGGADLTAKLLNLSVATGQPYHSIKKAWDEFCGGVLDRQMFDSVLDEMLKGDEPMISVEELAGPEFQKLVIDDFQRQFDCDPMLVLLTVMSAMGTVLPLNTKVRGLSHTQHWRPGVLFVMILVVSGGMKSMLLEELVEKPITGGQVGYENRRYCREANACLSSARKDNPESFASFAGAHQWMQDWANNLDSQYISPLMHVVSDFTGEGIDRNAKQNEDFPGYRIGTLLTTDEGRQLMGGDRYKSGGGSAGAKYTLDKLKRAWDGKGPSAVRGNKSLERNYDRIRLGILAFIQPEVYDEIASDETDDACGFWPRFLAYEAPPVQLRDDLTPADRRHIAEHSTFRKYLDDLYASIYCLHLIPLNMEHEVCFTFSTEAEDWWYPIQCQIGRESTREAASGDGVMGRLLGKLPALVVDVSLLLHLLKMRGNRDLIIQGFGCSGPGQAEIEGIYKRIENKRTIPLETVKAAYTLCRQLMLRTAKQRNRAQGDGSGDRAQFLVKVQATAQKLDPDQNGLPVGQLQKGWNGAYLKKHPETKDLIYQALGALADRGLGELTLSKGNNRGFRYRWTQPVTT